MGVRSIAAAATLALGLAATIAAAEDQFEKWPVLRSTFPSTGGGGMMIKGYDPVITGAKCITTFMAVEPGPNPNVYTSEPLAK